MEKNISLLDLFKEFFRMKYVILITLILSSVISFWYFDNNRNVVKNNELSINFLDELKENDLRSITRRYNNLLSVLNQFERDYISLEEINNAEILPKFTQQQNERLVALYLDILSDSFVERIALESGLIEIDSSKWTRKIINKRKKDDTYYLSLAGYDASEAELFLLKIFERSVEKLIISLTGIYEERITNDLDFLNSYASLLENRVSNLKIRVDNEILKLEHNRNLAEKLSIELPNKEFRNQFEHNFFLGTQVLDNMKTSMIESSDYNLEIQIIENHKKFLANIIFQMETFKNNIGLEIKGIYDLDNIDYSFTASTSDGTFNKIIFTQIIVLLVLIMTITLYFIVKVNNVTFRND